MTTNSPHNEETLQVTYDAAEELTVFWCPIIDPPSEPSAHGTLDSLIDQPQKTTPVKYVEELTAISKELAGSSWDDSLVSHCRQIYRRLLGSSEGVYGTPYGRRKDLSRRDRERIDREDVIHMAHVEFAGLQPETLKFCRDGSTNMTLSFGLWKRKSDALAFGKKPLDNPDGVEPSWIPQVNVCRTYKRSSHEVPTFDTFKSFLKDFSERMLQTSIYFKLGCQAWMYTNETSFFEDMQEVKWSMSTTTDDDWAFQFKAILDCLNKSARTIYWRAIDERVTVWGEVLHPEFENLEREFYGLGATIEWDPQNMKLLKLSVAGPSSYLFKPFFYPFLGEALPAYFDSAANGDFSSIRYRDALSRRVDIDVVTGSDAILLDCQVTGEHLREVLYAFYTSDPDVHRCLCGRSYPQHLDNVDHGIADLRTNSALWIKEQYAKDPTKDRGQGWRWELLSSPHFYFAQDHHLLSEDNSDEEQKLQCEFKAKGEAITRWDKLMENFFEAAKSIGQ